MVWGLYLAEVEWVSTGPFKHSAAIFDTEHRRQFWGSHIQEMALCNSLEIHPNA